MVIGYGMTYPLFNSRKYTAVDYTFLTRKLRLVTEVQNFLGHSQTALTLINFMQNIRDFCIVAVGGG